MHTENTDLRGRGNLIVAVYTAGGAVPVEGATVTVMRADGGEGAFTRTVQTDRSGKTPVLSLPTNEAGDSLSPGNGTRPYATYDIRVTRDGYYIHENRGAPVFAGVNSLQQVELIPLALYAPENAVPNGNLIFISEQTLDGQEER